LAIISLASCLVLQIIDNAHAWYDIKTISGEHITFTDKKFSKEQIYGGLIFGLGWGLTGACPEPLFAQIGMGATVVNVALISGIAGI
jgi:uncharacterized membrane protein YedE/YeeE